MKYDLVIRNGRIVLPEGTRNADLCIKDGKIANISTNDIINSDEEIDANGNYVLPGFIDPHVHLNDPGLTNSEDFYTGTCAAAAGGITTVLEHPLTFPLPDNVINFEEKKKIGEEKAVVNFGLFGACSAENDDEIAKMIDSGAIAFKTFLPYSTEIPMLNDGQIMEKMKFLADYDIVLAIHCENNDIVEHFTKKKQREGKIKPEDYPKGRPEIAEIEAVSRMCLFSRKTGCKINIAHCSLSESVDIVSRERQYGANVSIETCPQYLILNESNMKEIGVFSICNPPLRTEEEVERLWDRIFDGKIDWVCSDHATYTIEEKMAGKDNCFLTPAGVTSVELAFQLFFSEGVIRRGLPIESFVRLSSSNAAKRYRLFPNKGQIALGSDADIVIFNPDKEWTVVDERLKQMIKWSPYNGMRVNGKVEKTIVGGKIVYDGCDITTYRGSGKFISPI